MSAFWSDFKLILSLAFIVALAYVSIRLLGKRASRLGGQRAVRIVAALPLGANKTLQVVVVDEKAVLLLGVGANIENVARFDDPELAAKLLRQADEPALPGISGQPFTWLSDRARAAGGAGRPDFAQMLKARLSDMVGKREEALRHMPAGARDKPPRAADEKRPEGGDS